jgi:hypothetical protein
MLSMKNVLRSGVAVTLTGGSSMHSDGSVQGAYVRYGSTRTIGGG